MANLLNPSEFKLPKLPTTSLKSGNSIFIFCLGGLNNTCCNSSKRSVLPLTLLHFSCSISFDISIILSRLLGIRSPSSSIIPISPYHYFRFQKNVLQHL